MAIGFKNINEPTTPTTTSTSELPLYQTDSAVTDSGASMNITSHPLELTVPDSTNIPERNEVDSSLKNTKHHSKVNSGVIGVKIAEMVSSVVTLI